MSKTVPQEIVDKLVEYEEGVTVSPEYVWFCIDEDNSVPGYEQRSLFMSFDEEDGMCFDRLDLDHLAVVPEWLKNLDYEYECTFGLTDEITNEFIVKELTDLGYEFRGFEVYE